MTIYVGWEDLRRVIMKVFRNIGMVPFVVLQNVNSNLEPYKERKNKNKNVTNLGVICWHCK